MNKFTLINTVLLSALSAENKCLLIELITRANNEWVCWPSVERLCKARGIRHEKNFKGAHNYLPGLVVSVRRGRRNYYTLNVEAISGLPEADVRIKHTDPPATQGGNSPATPDDTPATAGVLPPEPAGANSSINTTKNSSENSSKEEDAGAPSSNLNPLQVKDEKGGLASTNSGSNSKFIEPGPATAGGLPYPVQKRYEVAFEKATQSGYDPLLVEKARAVMFDSEFRPRYCTNEDMRARAALEEVGLEEAW